MSLERKLFCVEEQLGSGMNRLKTKLTKDNKYIRLLLVYWSGGLVG